jgi:7-cyano-7-deazaguanine synthase in queuosine biosynthesis
VAVSWLPWLFSTTAFVLIEAFQLVVDVGTKDQIEIEAPFTEWSRADIAEQPDYSETSSDSP